MEAIICDVCKNTIKDLKDMRRIIIHEKKMDRVVKNKYLGHTKLDVCIKCLNKLGYIKR